MMLKYCSKSSWYVLDKDIWGELLIIQISVGGFEERDRYNIRRDQVNCFV